MACRTPDGVELLRDVIGFDRFVVFDRQARVTEHLEPSSPDHRAGAP